MKQDHLELIRDYLDDRIDADGLARLNQLLESDHDARAEFRAMATMEEGLRDLSISTEIPFPEPKRSKRRIRVEHLGIAALFVLCLALAVLLGQKAGFEDEWGDAIARIEFLSDDVRFDPSQQLPTTEDSLLGKGWVQLERGRMKILFRSGATVEAEGPAALGIDTPMRAYLDFGKVRVHAPKAGRDFVVATESMEVVDLGTRFEVEVDPQSRESNVSVIEGLVDLHLGSRGADRRIRPLEAGYAARVDAFGEIVEITGKPQPDAIPVPQIVAHWKFDESGANGEIEDSSGRGLNGVASEGGFPNPVPGVSGQALEFSGNEFVDLGEHVREFGQLREFTFAAWVREPRDHLAMLFSLSGNSEQQRVQLYLAARFVRYGWQDGAHFDSISGRIDGWETGRWYHVAVIVDEDAARLYRDGEMIASGSVGSRIGTPVSNPFSVKNPSHAYIGWLVDGRQGNDSAPQRFEGQMDDVQLYSGALSQDAIQFLAEQPGKIWKPDKAQTQPQ